jgi:hypothetical protein
MWCITIHMTLNHEDIHQALTLLGELLDETGQAPVHLVVCGGSALQAAAIVGRTTKDVDVLARRGEVDGEVSMAYPLPAHVAEAAAQVARELRLPNNWFNAATSLLTVPLEQLPAEVWSDLEEREYGRSLRLGYVGRVGLIYLKMSAVIGRTERRDLEDLQALAPNRMECEAAVQWLRNSQLINQGNRTRLESVLKKLGHDELGKGITE